MSRRDTIIIAILVNTGLLIALFATGVRNQPASGGPTVTQPTLALTEEQPTQNTDALLNQYVSAPQEIHFQQDLGVTPVPEPTPIAAAPKPAPEPAVETPAQPSTVNVTVKKGDFLEKIARANNTTVAAIMKENNLASSQLKVGQVLRVPVKESAPQSSTPPAIEEAVYYTVKDGESPWVIASKNNVRLDTLLKLNGLDEQKAKRLRPGDKLRIR